MIHPTCPDALFPEISPAPVTWSASCTHHECSFHQLSPYIGKLKSAIARDLILEYTRPGHLVADIFCGSGTVPLEAARLARRVFASDASLYAVTLTKGKLQAPPDLESALADLNNIFAHAESFPPPDLGQIPDWVKAFYHPQTLTETLRLVRFLKSRNHFFFLSALLGILHHQRPGFLSFPSSHLVPYLRSKKFPRATHPELYRYRSIRPRLTAKVIRAYRRPPSGPLAPHVHNIVHSAAMPVLLPDQIDCVISSPPYMNALDYHRDNRLRLWFLGEDYSPHADHRCDNLSAFRALMRAVSDSLAVRVRAGGHCVFVVGERTSRGFTGFPAQVLIDTFLPPAGPFDLRCVVRDTIPDVRRARRRSSGVRVEHVLVFRRN